MSSEPINVDLQSSMLLETLRQTPSIQDHHQQDTGGSAALAAAGDGSVKGTSSSSLSSSAGESGGGGDGGSSEKTGFEAMDPAILSATAPSGAESPPDGTSEKSNRTRYSLNQLLALRYVQLSKKKPSCIEEPKSEKHVKMFSTLLRPSETPYDEESGGGGNGPTGNYGGRNRTVYSSSNGSGSGGGGGGGSGNNGGSGVGRIEIRRSGGMDLRDPKDRLRKEDGIVLSPQRRSFNMGCQMPAAPTSGTSNLTIGGGLLRNERDLLGPRERRIGSGRILSRDVSWDYRPDKDAPESNDYRTSNNLGFRDRGGEREIREPRDTREPRDAREPREPREVRDVRDARDTRETRDSRDSRDRTDRDKDFRKEFDRDRDRDRDREDRFERRPLNNDYDRHEKEPRNSRMSSRYSASYNDSHGGGNSNNNHHSNRYSNNHYHSHHDRRRLYSNNDEEPEWFSEPTSQNDTIELRGFDDPVPEEDSIPEPEDSKLDAKRNADKESSKRPPSSLRNDKNNNSDMSDLLGGGVGIGANDKVNSNLSLAPGGDSTKVDRTPGDGASEGSVKSAIGSSVGGMPSSLGQSKIADDDFNFEDFLKLDALPTSLLYPDVPSKDSGSTGGSRFSQWFRQDNTPQSQAPQPPGQQPQQQQQQHHQQQPQQQQKQLPNPQFDSRRSSLQDEINNMINDFTSNGLEDHMPDTNSNKYFAPISPAASTSSNSLLELFQRSEKQQQQQQQQQQQHQNHHQQHREREHNPQQHQQPPQQHGHPHGHPLLSHPPNHPGLHHQQQQQQQQQHHQQMQNRNLQQLLGVTGGGNIGHGPLGPAPSAPNVGQIHSVEELEARFRQNDVDGNTRGGGGGGGGVVGGGSNAGPSIPRLITPSSGGNGGGHSSNVDQQQEMNAFKKLLAQISDSPHGQHSHNAQPPPGAHPPHHQSHPVNMLHHQQNELLQKMLHLNQMHHPVNDARQVDILKRPEAQALLHGVARGEVSQHNLWQQLANPTTAQPHREILSSVLNTFNTSPRVVSPNILIQPSPGGVPILPQTAVPPAAAAVAVAAANSANLLFQHHSKQQMRLSPLPNGMPQRIPSPRELQFHTQSIMQNALIRKKLEEQRENYRKRQEQQQQQQNRSQPDASSSSASTAASSTTTTSTTAGAGPPVQASVGPVGNQQQNSGPPSIIATAAPVTTITTPAVVNSITSPAKQNPPSSHSHSQHTSSPTPLAFTPTSVLRKMTAEKETEPLSSNNNSNASNVNANSGNAGPAQQNDRPLIGTLIGLNNPLTPQQQQQQRNLSALIGQHPPHQPPPNQQPPQQGPPPQMPLHHLGGGHLPNPIAPQIPPQSQQQQPPPQQPNAPQMRGNHQPPGMPGNIPWNLKQPHPAQQMPPMQKPQGRPILKGGNAVQPPQQPQPPHPAPMSQMSFASNLEFQQQMQQFQSRSGNPILGSHQTPQQLLQQQPQPPHNQHQNQMNPHLQQLLQQRQQQQQRAIRNQHMQQIPPSFPMGPGQRQPSQTGGGPGQHPHPGPGQQQPQGGSGIINYGRDGGLSPTSNQLARWFSPELLAQASAGKLPSLNIGQAMSLEEFERNMQHSSATVHN